MYSCTVPAQLCPAGLTLHRSCLLQVSSDCIKGFLESLGLPAEVRTARHGCMPAQPEQELVMIQLVY